MAGFIDRRADEIKKCLGLPVYSVREIKQKVCENTVVFIAVKNVYYHAEIVAELNSLGIYKVVYKSRQAIAGEMGQKEKILDAAYEGIYKKGIVLPLQIPVVASQRKINWNDNVLIRETKNDVIVKIPVELLYTGETDEMWTNVPVMLLVPYIDMFLYFQGEEKYSIHPYIKLCQKGAGNENLKTTQRWKEYVIQNRRDIYEQMYIKYEFEPEYFLNHAPAVAFSKNYFSLVTGKHRVCFLISLGIKNIPVRISKSDWKTYADHKKIARLREVLQDHADIKIPIPHPFFQGTVRYNSLRYQTVLQKIIRFLYHKKLIMGSFVKIDSVVDFTGSCGYFARFFRQMGLCAYADIKQFAFIDTINDLFLTEISDYAECSTDAVIIIMDENTDNNLIDKLNVENLYLFQIYGMQKVCFRECQASAVREEKSLFEGK